MRTREDEIQYEPLDSRSGKRTAKASRASMARLRLVSVKRALSCGMRSPVVGAIELHASARSSCTAYIVAK